MSDCAGDFGIPLLDDDAADHDGDDNDDDDLFNI